MRHFKPPQQPQDGTGRVKVFFGGTIEMGAAEDWQQKLADHLATLPFADQLDVYNPRRDGWDSSWPNDYSHPEFRAQVDWELARQKEADIIVYFFADGSVSPITLFELGLFRDRNPVVGSASGYKRFGNLIVTKDHFPFDLHVGWDDFLKALDSRLDAEIRRVRKAPQPPAPSAP